MDLKSAAAVCLISFFSATLVLLIARALDVQTASRLEPQLAKIVEELQAIRNSGGVRGASGSAAGSGDAGVAEGRTIDDGVMVYFFHGKQRCPDCLAIESQAHDTVRSNFASELVRGEMAWKVLNFEEPEGKASAEQFGVSMAVVVLARMKDGQIEQGKRLDRVWALVRDKPAFAEYLREEIVQMRATADSQQAPATEGDALPIPVPQADRSEIPIPTDSTPLPLPEHNGESSSVSPPFFQGETR